MRRRSKLRRRYGHSTWAHRAYFADVANGRVDLTSEKASIRDAQMHADITGTPWIVVYYPKLRTFHEYGEATVERTPIRRAHYVVTRVLPHSRRRP